MTPADYAGIVTCITATTGGIAAVIVAVRQPKIARQVEETHTAVSTSNGDTIAALVEKIAPNDADHTS